MKVGLFFGSFNPIHIGHLIIANHFVEFTALEEVWFVVSPQSPFKKDSQLLDVESRIMLVDMAIAGNSNFKVCTVELDLPQPSYTINTLNYLKEIYADCDFKLIMGSDNIETLKDWKSHSDILEYGVFVYKRMGSGESKYDNHPQVKFFDFPFIDISATYIRSCIKQGKSIKYLLPPKVWTVIKEKQFFK